MLMGKAFGGKAMQDWRQRKQDHEAIFAPEAEAPRLVICPQCGGFTAPAKAHCANCGANRG